MIILFTFVGIIFLVAFAGIYWLVAFSIMRDDIDGQYYDSLMDDKAKQTIS